MNKLSFALFLSLLSLSANATPFGRIVEVKGEGFISHAGKTKDIRVGDIVEMNSEIVVEHSGQVTFTDNADHRFHMGNSSSVAVYKNHLELRSGDLWFQSQNRVDDYKVTTANASVFYQGGEAILSYDTVKGKTQLMVINGMMKLANLRATELNLSVAEGNFSFVDNAYDEGAPRDPTPVGEKTYRQLVSLFKNVSPMEKSSEQTFKDNDQKVAGRTIASVVSDEKNADLEAYKASLLSGKKAGVKKENIVPKSDTVVEKTPVKAVKKTVSFAATPLEVKIYGLKTETPVKNRAPASVLDEPVPAAETMPTTPIKEHYKESEKLIDQLKSL